MPNDPSDANATARLEWGFAGTSISTSAEYDSGRLVKPGHTIWQHWVDSKTTDKVEDEGDMFPIENTNLVLEKGAMVNPTTGKVTKYEELWEDLDAIKVGDEAEYISWVLIAEGLDPYVRGKVIRIGQWIEAVLRIEGAISVARWLWNEKDGWKRVLAIGNLGLPAELFGAGEIPSGKGS